MYNKAIEILERLKGKTDTENLELLIQQYQYGHFNKDFDKEFNNYIRRLEQCFN